VSAPIRVLVVDDQSMIRAGLRSILEAEADILVVAEAHDGHAAIEAASTERPDVVLMDVRMPGLDGIAATRRILRSTPGCHVIILTTFEDEQYMLEGIRAGAAGFLLKDAGPDLLVAAVRLAAQGDSLIDPSMTRRLVEHRLAMRTEAAAEHAVLPPAIETLSDREREVLVALARGLGNADIARLLHVSEATVKTHVGGILTKTGTHTRVQAAVLAYETGFVRPGWMTDPAPGG
jgi:DNA-binding NarL/FixJ family response regulator